LPNIGVSPVDQNDVIDWWDAFLRSNHDIDVKTGLISEDRNRMFLFAQYERDIPSSRPVVRGTANLASGNAVDVKKIVAPVITTAAETPEFAAQETAFTALAHCYVRRLSDLISIPFIQISASAKSGKESNYDGLWFGIQADDLESGDKIEFGALGVRGFTAQAIWEVAK
jgi:hypothetical protein